jgi:hypothetical protein
MRFVASSLASVVIANTLSRSLVTSKPCQPNKGCERHAYFILATMVVLSKAYDPKVRHKCVSMFRTEDKRLCAVALVLEVLGSDGFPGRMYESCISLGNHRPFVPEAV